MSFYDWEKHGWASVCYELKDGESYCVAAIKDGEAPVPCVDDSNLPLPVSLARCPTLELEAAGGRCASYYFEKNSKGEVWPADNDTYCLPRMFDMGVVTMNLATFFWDD